jgi:hypothetical protein
MRKLAKASALCVCLLGLHASASAALGESEASIAADKKLFSASQRAADLPQYSLRETRLDSGTLVREYVSAKGIVFAVAWQGPFLPDLRQLLGKYFGAYTDAARSNPARRGPLRIDGPELVVQSAGRMRAFSGRAYLPREIPENFSTDMIQ